MYKRDLNDTLYYKMTFRSAHTMKLHCINCKYAIHVEIYIITPNINYNIILYRQ